MSLADDSADTGRAAGYTGVPGQEVQGRAPGGRMGTRVVYGYQGGGYGYWVWPGTGLLV